MMRRNHKSSRTGGVYITVLGTALVVGLLGMSALVGQRIENRAVVASSDIRQAQLNANSAIEMGLLVMKQESNWRSTQTNGPWFSSRDTGAGTCMLEVIDPIDGNLADDPDDPVVMVGVGNRGDAEQRVKLTVEPQSQGLSSLRSAIAAGETINVQGHTLRTDGLITANQVTATGAQVYGDVEAVSVSGSTFAGTTQQVDAAKLPTMPNWSTILDYYRSDANSTRILIGNVPSSMPSNLGRNASIETGTTFWTGSPPGMPTAQIEQSTNYRHFGSNSLRVSPNASGAGAAQRIDAFVKPGQQYYVEAWVDVKELLSLPRSFNIRICTKGTDDVAASSNSSPSATVALSLAGLSTPAQITGTVTAPPWTGDLEYAFIMIRSTSNGTVDFYLDDLVIRDTSTGRFIFRRVLGPGSNPFGAPNPRGIYRIDCAGQRITIDRSRILGTLLIINPGPGSSIASGPIEWSPYVGGYPALLVAADDPANANFTIRATNRILSESEQGVNYNPAGAPHEQLGSDNDMSDIYPSVIRGLVAVQGDFAFQNRPFVRGQLLVGGNIANSAGELDVAYQADSLLNPPPGFLAPHTHSRRPGSVAKAVLP